jgi:hypothetical protein
MHGFAYIFCCWGWFNFIYVVGLLFFMCKFFGHPVYYCYNAKKFLGLIKFHRCYFLWQPFGFFFSSELCLLAVLSSESIKGQKKA